MHLDIPSWAKRTVLTCMVILGVQFCCESGLQASVLSSQQVDMISLGMEDPEDKPGIHADLHPPLLAALMLLVPSWAGALAGECQGSEVPVLPAFLPVAGLHPSAP